MNGLEALQALMDGKTIKRTDGIMGTVYFCYRQGELWDDEPNNRIIWTRTESEWNWRQCKRPTEYWMRWAGFEVVEE